jgi:hypothetical protein
VICLKKDFRGVSDEEVGVGEGVESFAEMLRARERREGEDFECRSLGREGIPRRPWRGVLGIGGGWRVVGCVCGGWGFGMSWS